MKNARSPYTFESKLLGALAHPIRLQILDVLRDGEVCVCHIQAVLRRRQAYVSQHLMALRRAGLVTRRKDGLRVYYRLSDPRLFDAIDGVREIAYARANGGGQPSEADLVPAPGRCNCPRCAPVAA